MEFTADQVWACAAAAQRLNGDYVKEPVWDFAVDQRNPIKQPNKMLVKQWLREGRFDHLTEADYAAGKSARDHFKSYTLLAIAGRLNDFQQTAMKIAAMDEFTGRNMYEFAVISCLLDVARRDQAQTELKREIYSSEALPGDVGDVVIGDITVIRTRYSKEYNKYRIDARMGDSVVDFWYGKELQGTVRIKGKIKQQRGNGATQLNYVKISG